MFTGSDDDDSELMARDPAPLDRSWNTIAWALVLSFTLHLGLAGPLFYMLNQVAWEPTGPVLTIELSNSGRMASAVRPAREPEKSKPAVAGKTAPEPPPATMPVKSRARRHAAKRIPVSDSKLLVSKAPPETRAVETTVAAVSAPAPATRAVEQASSKPLSTVETSRREPGFHLLYAPQPMYPRVAQRLGLEGRVVLRIWVTASGVPDVVVISQSSGYDSLDVSAKEGVRKWRFESAGALSGGWVTQPVTFRLE